MFLFCLMFNRACQNAIKFKDTVQRAKAEAKLNEAIALECKASNALKEATSKSSSTKLPQSATAFPFMMRQVGEVLPEITSPAVIGKAIHNEESFLDVTALLPPIAKISSTEQARNISPLLKLPSLEDKKTIAARTKIEEAEAVLAIAEKAHDDAQKMIRRSGKIDVETERVAYRSAEEAWIDTIIQYEAALEKAKVAKLDSSEIEELSDAFKEAKENAAHWTAHMQTHAQKLEEIAQLKAEQEALQQLKTQVTEKTFLIGEQIK